MKYEISYFSMQFCTSLSVAREREELVRGTQVLENTQQWFQSRLAVLSLEEQQRVAGSEQVGGALIYKQPSPCM